MNPQSSSSPGASSAPHAGPGEIWPILWMRALEEAAAASPARAEQLDWRAADAAAATTEGRRAVGEQGSPAAFLAARGRAGLGRWAARGAAREPAQAAIWQRWQAVLARHAAGGPGGGELLPSTLGPGLLLLALAAAIGFAGDALTAGGRINLLAPPLLGLLIWNALVYLALAAQFVFAARLSRNGRGPDGGPTTPGLLRGLAEDVVRRLERWQEGVRARSTPAAAVGLAERVASELAPRIRPALVWRAAGWMHAAAAALASGGLASMYARGIAADYRAGWASTFLGPDAVHALLRTVLGPASALTGLPLPDVAGVAALQAPPGVGEPAAPWIHLFAVTVAGFVVLPRLALAAGAAWRARREEAGIMLPLDQPYHRALLRDGPSAQARRIAVLPYSFHLDAGQRDALPRALATALGQPARVLVADVFEQGSEDAVDARLAASLPQPPPEQLAVLFNASATPERETHGVFARALVERFGADGVVLTVDLAGQRRLLGQAQDAQRRLEQRFAAWQRMAAELGLPAPLALNLAAPDAVQPLRLGEGA